MIETKFKKLNSNKNLYGVWSEETHILATGAHIRREFGWGQMSCIRPQSA